MFIWVIFCRTGKMAVLCPISRICYCRDLRAFCVNFLSSKCRSRKSFDKYHVCQQFFGGVEEYIFKKDMISGYGGAAKEDIFAILDLCKRSTRIQ